MQRNQNGFGFIMMILSLALIGLILLFVYNNYLSSDDQSLRESSEELIEDAQDSVNKANEAREKAEQVIDLAN